ncbi:MAG: NfeD family protein [Acidimicrobiales bacterium]
MTGLLGLVAMLAAGTSAPPAAAHAGHGPVRPAIDIVQVGGILDPVNVELLRRSIREAPGRDTTTVVIQLDSSASSVPIAKIDALGLLMSQSEVPVAVWVGPTGTGRALGPAFSLVAAADVAGMAERTIVGRSPEPVFDGTAAPLANRTVGPEEALRSGIVEIVAPTLSDFIGQLDGREVKGRMLSTAGSKSPFVLRNDLDIRFRNPGLVDRTLHGLGSPSATYFFVVAGLLLLLFEFFSAGIGIAAATGAVCLALSAYGIGTLDTRPVGLGLVVLATVAFGVDIQAGSPRFWTGAGTVALVLGSLTMFEDRRPGWLALGLVTVGGLLAVLFGIPSTVRTRFSTPTIGREDLVGASGSATTPIDPEGTVEVRGAPWRARTFPKPIAAGAAVEVVAIEGLVLEVVPAGTELEPSRAEKRQSRRSAT